MNAKLSVWTAYYADLGPEDAVRELKRQGICCGELSDEHGAQLLERGPVPAVAADFRAFLSAEGFDLSQGHLWLRCFLCTDDRAMDRLLRWIELYEALGVRNAVLHCDPFFDAPDMSQSEKCRRNIEKLLELQGRTAGLSMRICLENLIRVVPGIEEVMAVWGALDPRRFGVCLDTGHLNLHGGDQRAFILRAGRALTALHIADNEGKADQHMMPFGRGTVDFEAVVRALREVDYQGLFNLEIPGERRAPLPVRGYKLHYIRQCYDYLMQVL